MNRQLLSKNQQRRWILKISFYLCAYTLLYLPLYTIGLGLFNFADHKPFVANWAKNLDFLAIYIFGCIGNDLYFTDERQKAIQSRIPKTWLIPIMAIISLAGILTIVLFMGKLP